MYIWNKTDMYSHNYTTHHLGNLSFLQVSLLQYASKEEDMGWKGKGNTIQRGKAKMYIIPWPFQPISSSLLPYI